MRIGIRTSNEQAIMLGKAKAMDRGPAVDGRWYAPTSAFNTPISGSPTVSPDSAAQVAYMAANNTGQFSPGINMPTIVVANNSTPLVTLQVNFPVCDDHELSVPIPSGAPLDSYTEQSMILVNSDTDDEWNFFKITPPNVTPLISGPTCGATANWAATVAAHTSPGWKTGSGVGATYRGSGTVGGAGVIRPRDTKVATGGTWDHAIAVALPNTRNTFVAPATASDGTHTDAASVPEGARIQLDPAFDVAGSGLPEWQKQICRTLQVYGMIVVDSGSSLINEGTASVHATGYTWPWEGSGYPNLPVSVINNFRVLYSS